MTRNETLAVPRNPRCTVAARKQSVARNLAILCVLMSVPTNAADFTPALKALGDAMTTCYLSSAIVYGSTSCRTPRAIAGAAIGSCARQEAAFKAQLLRENPENPEIQESVVATIRANMTPELEKKALDSQSIMQRCR